MINSHESNINNNHQINLNILLGPSKFSSEGFLGNDKRDVKEIIKQDLDTLNKSGITKKEFVEALKRVYHNAELEMGSPYKISENVFATHYDSKGKIPSPFPEDEKCDKGEVVVKNIKTSETFCITPLSIMLIEKHDFFQGKGSHYRIDPELAIKMLGLK
jgi:hypothetical protein